MDDLLRFSRELAAIGQAGITYSPDPYDQERFERIREMAGELLRLKVEAADFEWPRDDGYDTPKVDVRAMVFREGKILLVKETTSGLWTPPGGWADVNYSAAENAVKECEEESGYVVEVRRLISIIDREKAGYPGHANSIYKIFFLCEVVGGEAATSLESSAVGFFAMDELPPLDVARVQEKDLMHAYRCYLDPSVEAKFN